MAAPVLPLRRGLLEASSLPRPEPDPVPRARLIELATGPGAASVTAAVQIALLAQREGDPVAWLQLERAGLFPPDLAACGLDLAALAVVHVPRAEGALGLAKGAELVLRTGAFGAVVLDLTGAAPPRGEAWLSRLGALAREHDCRVVLLGAAAQSSRGAMIALRLRAVRKRQRPGRFTLEAELLRRKAGLSASLPSPAVRGPEGLP